ncbi:MAG: HlyD family efflux transporter periplasmic adaptor subunit [Planctomycetia bacterium]|nr:HlyD family efflux transporter periplasmic adaptor subunit [Planctomycetia bacterium]
MTATTTSNPLLRLLSLVPLLFVALGLTGAATYWRWPQPARDRVIRMLGGIPADGASPIAATEDEAHADDHAHDHDHDHDHDHEGHVEEHSLELSEQARRSIGLREGDIALTTFYRTISLPGIVVERRGRSRLTIIAPITGSVTNIFVTEGEAVAPDQPLFELRLTHEEIVQAQADLLKTTEEVDVVRREIARLEGIGPEGIVAVKTILERRYELQKLEAIRTAQRQALMLHGLSEQQVDDILTKRRLLGSVVVRAPAAAGQTPRSGEEVILLVQELGVERGQHVTAGDTLAILADHKTLLVEGEAFEQDIPQITQAAADNRPVVAVLESRAGPQQKVDGLQIAYVANRIDTDSRALHFYVQLQNEVVRDKPGDANTRFVEWRYKPGQRMQLRVPVEEWTDRIVLPTEAVAQDGVESYVFRLNGDHFDRQAVHVEHRDPQWVVVANDGTLFPGDRVALSAAQQLQLALKNKSGGAIDPHAGHQH